MCDNCGDKKHVDFVHLHNHSEYSLLDGFSSTAELAKTAADLNFPAMALTDHGSCAGLYSFQKECIKNKIKPILGSELYITKNRWEKDKTTKTHHLLVLAKNQIGLKNLFYLSSLAEIEGKYRKPRIDMELLNRHKEGLICTSGCPASEIPMAISQGNMPLAKELMGKYKSLFNEDFYVEIMTHKYFNNKEQEEREINNAKNLLELAKEFNVKAIATNDIHYAKKEQWEYQDLMLAMQTGDTIKNPDRFSFGSDQFYIKTYDEMLLCYKERKDLLTNTMEIFDKVESELIKKSDDLLPHFDIPPGYQSEEAYLKDLVRDGMKRMGFMDKKEYVERIRFEMSAIVKCGYTRYFLILWDIINFAKQQGIRVGCGRGSAAGSLCLYVLGIVGVDPIKYKLLFERFINPERVSPPDVDIDFDYYRRDEIFDYITRKYTKEHCSKIGTYGSLGAKAVIRYAVKALDLGNDWEATKKMEEKGIKGDPPKRSLFLADMISKSIPFGPDMTIETAMQSKDGEDFKGHMERYPKLYNAVKKVEGKYNSAGVHAAGIVVCKNNIIDHLPLRERDGVICSQFDKVEVEELGLLKFDCLGLKTVTVIYETQDLINKRHGLKLNVDTLEPNDQKVFKLLKGGYHNMDNRGVFQFESPGMMKLLKNMNVDSIEDMIAANALYRPGPLGAKVHELYCEYKNGTKEIKPLHPKMGEILKDTYSLICYQEDFMKIAQELAGFTKGQSDVLRKAVGKKNMELMAKQRESFVAGCMKNGVEKSIAEEIFTQIEYFGGYGFNRCLSGDTTVKNLNDNKLYTLKELCSKFRTGENPNVSLNSLSDREIVPDIVEDVFETGEKELYEVELENGFIVKCTMDHKFYCSDYEKHTLEDIINDDFGILCEAKSSKIKSVKPVGVQQAYNVTMASAQHNYEISNNGMSIYSMNSHSCAYSMLAYQTSWLKVYFPLEFMCNLLTSELTNEDKHDIYLQEAKRMGISIRSPQINESKSTYVIVDKSQNKKESYLVSPFSAIKGLGDVAVENIVSCQPFKSFPDFIRKIDGRKVNVKIFNALVDAGCMDDIWGLARPELKIQFVDLREKINKEKKQKEKINKHIEHMTEGGGNLFDRMSDVSHEWVKDDSNSASSNSLF